MRQTGKVGRAGCECILDRHSGAAFQIRFQRTFSNCNSSSALQCSSQHRVEGKVNTRESEHGQLMGHATDYQ